MYESIPLELQEQKAWVNIYANSKVPMQTTQRKAASASDSATWGSYADAVANVQNGIYSNIGYVFHDTGLVGIDIDDGRDADGFLSPIAIDLIKHCKSYTEWSRSGRGVHILVHGHLPFKGKNNRAGVEVYQTSRYFIMTGKILIYDKIIENQDAVDYILSAYFGEENRAADKPITSQRIYNPIFDKPEKNKIPLGAKYPEIKAGTRNISLASLAGQLHSQKCSRKYILEELLRCNATACKPPLERAEVELIVNSIMRYDRG